MASRTETANHGSALSEEEMEALIESRSWPAYRLEMKECGRVPEDQLHRTCPGVRQPTNHIDPHPTICNCECHPWNEAEVEWEDDEESEDVEWLDEDDDVEWHELTREDEEELDWSEV